MPGSGSDIGYGCGVSCTADLDGDGAVGFSDLLIVLAEWDAS